MVLPTAALAAAGDLDASFDTDGKIATAIGSSDDIAQSIAIQSDGKIVAVGSSFSGSNNDFALARFESTSSPPADGTRYYDLTVSKSGTGSGTVTGDPHRRSTVGTTARPGSPSTRSGP